MRVLLINPDSEYWENKAFIPPSGLLYLASELTRNNIDVKLIDLNVVKFKYKDNTNQILLKSIQEYNPNLIGIGCLFSGIFSSTSAYAELIKSNFNSIKIVIGGLHPTMYHTEIIQNCNFIDYVVRGEGEISLLKLVKHIQGKLPIEEVPSLTYRENGAVKSNVKMEIITDLNQLPKLNFDLINVPDYHHPDITKKWWNPRQLSFKSTFPILTSRGCPMHCNFCSMFLVTGRKWRYETPSNVVDKLEFLYNTYDQKHFSFMDDNITLNKNRIIEICKEITRRGLNIQWETPNGISLKNLDDDILGAMCSAGMVRTSLAIESGSEYIRNKVMGKSLSTDQIYKVVDLTKKYDALYVQAYFIIGMPEDTEETLQETYNLIDTINIDYPRPANIVPFPGTTLFDQCYKDNLFTNAVDLKSLWKTKHSLFKTGTDFFIKPYNMSITRLREFRHMLDELVERKMEEKHLDRLKKLSFVLPDYNPLG